MDRDREVEIRRTSSDSGNGWKILPPVDDFEIGEEALLRSIFLSLVGLRMRDPGRGGREQS